MLRWCFTIFLATMPALAALPADPYARGCRTLEKSIRPILAEHCYSCHGEKKQNAGLRLDTAAGMNRARMANWSSSRATPRRAGSSAR